MEPSSRAAVPWYQRPVVWVFCGALLLRAWVLSRFAETVYFAQQTGDMKFYSDWADRILSGQWTDDHAFYGLPGYAYVLAGIYKVVGPNPEIRAYAVGFLQVLIEAITATIIFRIATRCFANEKNEAPGQAAIAPILGGFASLAWVLYVPAQAFSSILMPTCWELCLFWFCVFVAMRPADLARWWRWLGLGVLIGAMAMMVATILFAVPLLLARIGFSASGWEKGPEPQVARSLISPRHLGAAAVAIVLLVGGLFVGSSPAWIHNYFVAHDPVLLSAHSGLNFWMGNSPGATGYPKIPAGLRASQEGLLKDSITWAEKAAGHPLKRSEVSKYWAAKAHDYIESFPEAWHRLLLLKVRNFWNGFVYDDISVITILQERGVLLPGFSWGMIAPWAIAGAALALYRRSAAGWVLAAVLLHMLALMPVFITERYRMPAAPGLIILAVYGIWAIAVSKGYARLAALLVYVAIAITAADLFAMPTGGPELQALTPYNVGVKELEFAEERMGPEHSPEDRAVAAAELASAERHLNRAYALVQGDPGIVFALGNLALDKNDRAKAKAFYEQTLTLNPHFSGAWKNLGYLAVEEKQWPEAERYLKEAVKEDPTNAMTHYLLAQAQEALGKAEPARASAEEAHRLLPSDRRIQELRERLQSGPKQ